MLTNFILNLTAARKKAELARVLCIFNPRQFAQFFWKTTDQLGSFAKKKYPN